MKIIKIFLASSEELSQEREKMTDLVYQLNKLFKSRGLELDLEKWEYIDSSVSPRPQKQDDYNEILKECEMCLVIFWRKFGRFTAKEFDIARQQMMEGKNPRKIYVFFKNLDKEDDITPELKSFKEDIYNRYGHFYCRFANVDTMKLEFLLQLELYQKGLLGENVIKVRQEHVCVDNEIIADLNNITFVANNEGFRKTQTELKELRIEISKMQADLERKKQKLERKKAKLDKDPDDEDYLEDYQDAMDEVNVLVEKLQQKLDRKNKLEKDFDREQQNLFNTARRITELKGKRITGRMARAIEAFENGDAQRADAILDETEHDADEILVDLRVTKQVALQSLEELILKASVKMANDTISIEERVNEACSIYSKADNLAQEIGYDKKKYAKLLCDYGEFLESRDQMKAVDVFSRQAKLLEEIYGPNNINMARTYNNIAKIYTERNGENNLSVAWNYLEKALKVLELHLGETHPDVANTYRLMGILQIRRLQYHDSKISLERAIKICEETIGTKNIETALAYRDLGRLYERLYHKDKELDLYNASLKYHLQAIGILETISGAESKHILTAYNNLAILYNDGGEYDKALNLHKKAISIKERIFGFYHLSTAIEYNNLGVVYHNQADYENALSCYSKALKIKNKLLNKEDYTFSNTYSRIGITYFAMRKYMEAEEYFAKALEIRRKQLKEGDMRIKELQDELEKCEKLRT